MPILKHDIKNALPPRRVHGLAGDEVKVICRHAHIIIVEGPDKLKFPILDDDLVDRLPDAQDPPKYVAPVAPWGQAAVETPTAEPALTEKPAAPHPMDVPARRGRKTIKAEEPKPTNNQGSLF